jgi:hypothetical protein
VVIIYEAGLVLALLIGATVGLLITAAHYEQVALRQRQYEEEIAEGRELYAALAMILRIKPDHPADDKAPAA